MDPIRACVFDAYGTLLDVNTAVMKHAHDIGGCAEELSSLWRQRQLEYSWTRTLMGRYADFWQLTTEALDFALESFGLLERTDLKNRLLDAYHELSAYPDAVGTLGALKAAGFTTAILSNGNNEMLRGALRAGNLTEALDQCISVDEIKIYKPDPRVYQFACDRLDVRPSEVCFVSSNAWDIGGAGAFGFNTVRINRINKPQEYSFAPQRHQLSSLSELPQLLLRLTQ
ncbi:haloacid dehalogenase type II [Burkholderia cenocepacia]|uniref:(S)-2-haloacid dehalogenase 1 n=1 Tax=Pseudomonas sp. (strain CBS-3) TaxID=72586 RepID=HAD1_PSEUC|nr:haloacid dehalogenase type II [Burkholderia cenocepacia]P24069.2 RecName: Full=(S)-2-haloacid dehalogenase 1; AltName: Full=2-haloalkanoic acid dehalogenase I; AltName: Full=DEHCI; AltName: Full=Halocarboxylic acid halidohydrolase I; AltName: Full=L-2-haloacid dehalogenase I [Pseudomonas sp. CBS3]AAA63640.1 2-haloalkanoic acid dehalogenase I [Pseudomonas sp.]MDR5644413.1 haloacid dehalogenase type II [Burkholderia cenocepacia]